MSSINCSDFLSACVWYLSYVRPKTLLAKEVSGTFSGFLDPTSLHQNHPSWLRTTLSFQFLFIALNTHLMWYAYLLILSVLVLSSKKEETFFLIHCSDSSAYNSAGIKWVLNKHLLIEWIICGNSYGKKWEKMMKTSRQLILKYKQDEVLYEMKIFLRFLENSAITSFCVLL